MLLCFQWNSVAVLLSKLVSNIHHVPPGDYIGSSCMTGRKKAVIGVTSYKIIDSINVIYFGCQQVKTFHFFLLTLHVLYCKGINRSGGTSVQDYILVLHCKLLVLDKWTSVNVESCIVFPCLQLRLVLLKHNICSISNLCLYLEKYY